MAGDGKPQDGFDHETAVLLRAVAHDFNNLLCSVLGHADLLESMHSDSPGIQKRSLAIQKAALKGVEMTRKLAASGRDLAVLPESVSVGEELREELRRFQLTLPDSVVFEAKVPPDVRMNVEVRALIQIVSALLSNARNWCSSPGRITLTVRTTEAGGVLVVEDTGPGFPEERPVASLLEPFVGQSREGRGLGLWAVRRLVEAHGGEVVLRSGPGAAVSCHFPTGRALSAGD